MTQTPMEPMPSVEVGQTYTTASPDPGFATPPEFAGQELDLKQLGFGEGLPETGVGFDRLPEHPEANWDLGELNRDFTAPQAPTAEVAIPWQESLTGEEVFTPHPDLETIRPHATNPPLERIVSDIYDGQFEVDQSNVRQLQAIDRSGATLERKYNTFLEDQDAVAARLEHEFLGAPEPEPSMEAVETFQPALLPEITAETVERALGQTFQTIEPSLRMALNDDILNEYQALANDEELHFAEMIAMDRESQTTLPERKERLTTFELTSATSSNLEPALQYAQHLRELVRLIAILTQYGEGVTNFQGEAVNFDYTGEYNDLAELLAAVEDQYIITLTTKLLTENQDNLSLFQEAIEATFDESYEKLAVDLGEFERSTEPVSWAEAVSYLDERSGDQPVIEIEHQIAHNNQRSLSIIFPTLQEVQDDNATVSGAAVSNRTAKETHITPYRLVG